jgi:hypothetical protein
VPLKVKVFLWLTAHESILTRDVLLHRGWRGKEANCVFCEGKESINHLFFECALAKYLWSFVTCCLCLERAPTCFADIGSWIWRFPVKIRGMLTCGLRL